jgi:hypothetical protein
MRGSNQALGGAGRVPLRTGVSKIAQRRQAGCDRLMAGVAGRPRAVRAARDRDQCRTRPFLFGPARRAQEAGRTAEA